VQGTCQVLEFTNGSIIANVKTTYRIADTTQTSVVAVDNILFAALNKQVQNHTLSSPLNDVDLNAFTIYGQSQSVKVDPCYPLSSTHCDQICDPSSDSTSYQCDCFAGYHLNGFECVGSDTCGLNQDNCDPKTTYCLNGEIDNTFTCPCLTGFQPTNGVTNQCTDINECAQTPSVCNTTFSTCNNTWGSFICMCNPGYLPDGNNNCNEIDECALQTDHCDYTTTTCVNIPDSYNCVCRPGFANYANYYCSDVNECITEMPCNTNVSQCVNTFGSYMCDCIQGAATQIDATKCVDADECALQTDNCNVYTQTCINTIGNYTCACKIGFNATAPGSGLLGSPCADVDECLFQPPICQNMSCANTIGSYDCYCPPGFTVSTVNSMSCQAINECAINPNICNAADSYCVNHIGYYNCTCKYPANIADYTFPIDSSTGCPEGQFGFSITATSSSSSVSYTNVLASGANIALNTPPGSTIPLPTLPIISTPAAYWVQQTLMANGSATVSTSISKQIGLVTSLNGVVGSLDMTSNTAFLFASGSPDSIATTVKNGMPTGDGIHDTSLTMFNINAVFGSSQYNYEDSKTSTIGSASDYLVFGPVLTYPLVISVTTTAAVGVGHRAQVVDSNGVVRCTIIFDRTDTTEEEMVTCFFIVPTSPGVPGLDFFVSLLNGNITDTSYWWYQYTPLDTRYTTVLWSVCLSTPVAASPTAVPFDDVVVIGQPGLWSNYTIIAPVAGIYIINLNVVSAANAALDCQLYVNGAAKWGIIHSATTGMVTRSRAGLVTLNAGDMVSVRVMAGPLYGDVNRVTSFSGFLLYAQY